jgi:hypothetical protein
MHVNAILVLIGRRPALLSSKLHLQESWLAFVSLDDLVCTTLKLQLQHLQRPGWTGAQPLLWGFCGNVYTALIRLPAATKET